MPGERTDYLSWDEYFMSLALLSSQRSKDPKTQVGACIVSKNKKHISVGYNGAVIGLDDHFDMPWDSLGEDTNDIMQIKNTFVCHAEANAIDNFGSSREKLEGSTIYVTLFPCIECTKRIIMNGISKVVYLNEYSKKNQNLASMYMFRKAGVEVVKFQNKEQIINTSAKLIKKLVKD